MKTKLFTLLLAVAASMGTMLAWDYERVQIGDLYYNLDATNQTAEVARNSSASGEIIIPSSVTYNSVSYSVTIIGNYAFSGCSSLTSVTIPNSVTSIGDRAFEGCRGLTSVTIPNSVTSIGERAFYSCGSLTSVTIGNSVTSIGDYAFYGCRGLTSVTIGNSVTSIGDYAFRDCASLTSVTIGNSVTSIGEGAFRDCASLTSVTIGNSVTSIGEGAFFDCSGLTKVNITDIAAWCAISFGDYSANPLSYAHNLYLNETLVTDLVIPNSVTSIGAWAFDGCSSLTSVTIPNSVTSIGYHAFSGCSSLTSVTIGNSVTSIGNYAFNRCTGLTSVTIGNSVTNIGYYAFFGCSSLTSIYVLCGEMARFKQMLGGFEDKVKYAPLPYTITISATNGNVTYPQTICDDMSLNATPEYGYHFVKWSDGVTDNPRTIVLTQDTSFTAEFAINNYTITTESSNPQWGTTAGDNSASYLDEVEISATANYGYHFVKWNDNNTSNPRTISVTEDKTYTATFAKNVYTITLNNAEHGSISGDTSAEYLDEVTLTAYPDYGYHFTQWSDDNKENPRTFVLTQDTTFNAEFAIDKTGNCGDDNALIWTYDAETKTLTITGNGTLNSNYYFGIEAPTQMQKLVIGNEITSIGDSAFYGMSTINHLIIGGSVATIGNYAFAECRNFDDITCFATIVPVINETTFANVGNKQYIYLFVPEARERAYHRDTYWGEFDIQVQQAEETTVTTNDVQVEPQDNAATVTWPTSENAASYTIQITKDGVVFCTLIFNGNGQLTGIAFAPSRDGQAHAPAAIMTANGLQFTVTGLNSNTQYGYSVTAKDSNDQPVATYSGEFTTTGGSVPTDIDEVQSDQVPCTKVLINGQIFILRGDKTYTLQGQEVK